MAGPYALSHEVSAYIYIYIYIYIDLIIKTFENKITPKSQFINEKQSKFQT